MSDSDYRSTPTLIGDAVQHATALVSAELQLVRLEATEKLTLALASVVSIVVAGVVGLLSLLFLLAGVVLAIAKALPLFVACFIVGGVMAFVALITIIVAARNLSATRLKPTRILKQVQTATDIVRSPR